MAKQGAKRRVEDNKKRLGLLLQAIIAANVVHVAVRFLLWRASLARGDWAGLVLTSCLYYFCYGALYKSAVPTYGPAGEVVDGGADLNMGGILGYYQDLLYICIMVQVGSLLTRSFWLVFLTVPAYGGFMLWKHVVQPYMQMQNPSQQGGGGLESAAEQKRREKAERKQKRVQYRR